MIQWWIWTLLSVGLLGFVALRLLRPMAHRGVTVTAVKPLLYQFVADGAQGSLLVLEREGGPGLLQLRYCRKEGSDRSIEFGLPLVDWSAASFDKVSQDLGRAGFAVDTQGGGSCGAVRRFMRVCARGSTEGLAADCWRMLSIARDSLGWKEDNTFSVHVERPLRSQASGLVRRMFRAQE